MIKQRRILTQLKKLIVKKGAPQIAVDLGLSDSNSVNRWVRNQKIPNIRKIALIRYIKENGGSFDNRTS